MWHEWGDRRGAHKILVKKREVKRQFGRTMRKYEDDIKMDLKEAIRDQVDWIRLAKDMKMWLPTERFCSLEYGGTS